MAQGIFVLGGWPSCKMGGRPLPSQSSRVLKQWMDNGKLVGVGSGTYAKARPSSLSDQPVPGETLEVLPAEAFDHLGLAWKLGADAYQVDQRMMNAAVKLNRLASGLVTI